MAMRYMTMADLQLQAAMCSGGGRWSDARVERPPVAMSAPFSCSSADFSSGGRCAAGGCFNWEASPGGPVDAALAEPVGASDESPGSNNTPTHQDIDYPEGAYGSMAAEQMLDAYGVQYALDCEFSSSSTFDWNRHFLSTPRADDETSVHGLIEGDMYCARPYCRQEYSDQIHTYAIRSTLDVLEDRGAMSSSTNWDSVLLPASSALLERWPHELQVDETMQPPPFVETPQLTSTATQPKQQVQLTDEAPFWKSTLQSIAAESCSAQIMHHLEPTHDQLIQSEINIKAKSSGAKKCSSTNSEEKDDSEPVLKRPRIETPSPLPTFKVRKEKLGDRITALQQLVSPFGKTDTASVLHEAIDYIKFLHDQVKVLSSPNSKNGQRQRATESVRTNQDLRSRGLCLVSISSTVQMVARETPVDFLPLGFGPAHN